MPAYAVEFTSREGPQRSQFTIDHDRELGPQVRQVLEELRQLGVMIEGGPEDELAVYWNGRELDLARSAAEQGVSPRRELQLRMQPRRREAVSAVAAPARARGLALPRGAYAAPLTGFAGGLLAWTAILPLRDLNRLISTYARLDLLAGAVLGAAVCACVLGGDARRRDERAAAGAAAGLLLGALGGAAGAGLGWWAADFLRHGATPYLVQRCVAWLLLGAGIGAAGGALWWAAEPRRMLDGGVHGAVAGVVGGALFSLGGPADFWQALAFGVVGAGVGTGVCASALRRSLAVLELETLDGRWVGISRLREWGLREGTRVAVRAPGARARASAATVACEAGRCWIAPSGGAAVAVGGRVLHAPAELGSGDMVDLGSARFRFRRLGAVGV
jgi:hypothetical protein